jgi:hypothetical protein
MMRALWVPDDVAGGALVGTLLAPLPKQVRPLTLDEKATLAAFEDARVKRHNAGTTPPGALWIDARRTPSRAGLLDDSWLRRRLNDHASVKVGRLRE